MSKSTDEILKEFRGQEFATKRAISYHEYRIRFWTALLKTSEILEFFLGASAFVSLLADVPSMAKVLTLFSTLLAGLVICFQASSRLKNNMSQRNRFYEHLRMFPSDETLRTASLLDDVKVNRGKIQKDDGVLFPCLSVRCHNDLCQAIGNVADRHHLTWFQKHIGSLVPISYDEQDGGKSHA